VKKYKIDTNSKRFIFWLEVVPCSEQLLIEKYKAVQILQANGLE